VSIYAQLIVGAVMRHEQAGLAIPDFPTTYGKILPPTTTAEVNAINLQHLDSPNYTLAQMWLSFGHRIGALLVTIALITVILMAIRRRIFLRTIATIAALLVVQITLGILTVLLKKPADVASAHVAIGALVLMSTFVLAVRAYLMQTTRQPVAIGTNELDEKAIGVFA
jgi:cytochrome c oxidase assembly protein subunit 15